MTHIRKPSVSAASIAWGPWATAWFQTEIARDRFVDSVAHAQDADWGAEVMPNDSLGAQVRWRPGRFLRLNDVAYSHGGRIITTDARRGNL